MWLRYTSIHDYYSWNPLVTRNNYYFFTLNRFIKERVINYGDNNQLYFEWITLDKDMDVTFRHFSQI